MRCSFEELCGELWAAVAGCHLDLRAARGARTGAGVGLRAAGGPWSCAPRHGRDGRAPGRAGAASGGRVRLGPRRPADGGERGVHRRVVEAPGGARAAPARPRGGPCRGPGADAAWQGHRAAGCGARDVPGHRQRPRDERLDLHRPGHRLDRLGRRLGGGGGARCAQGTAARRCAGPGAGHARRHRTAGGGGGLARARAARRVGASWGWAIASTGPATRGPRCWSARWSGWSRRATAPRGWCSPGRWSMPPRTSCGSVTRTGCSGPTWSSTPRCSSTRLGLPREAFSPLFACGRVAGWLAHIDEQRRTGRLIRPESRYVGPRPE